jgi:hypothetical protein
VNAEPAAEPRRDSNIIERINRFIAADRAAYMQSPRLPEANTTAAAAAAAATSAQIEDRAAAVADSHSSSRTSLTLTAIDISRELLRDRLRDQQRIRSIIQPYPNPTIAERLQQQLQQQLPPLRPPRQPTRVRFSPSATRPTTSVGSSNPSVTTTSRSNSYDPLRLDIMGYLIDRYDSRRQQQPSPSSSRRQTTATSDVSSASSSSGVTVRSTILGFRDPTPVTSAATTTTARTSAEARGSQAREVRTAIRRLHTGFATLPRRGTTATTTAATSTIEDASSAHSLPAALSLRGDHAALRRAGFSEDELASLTESEDALTTARRLLEEAMDGTISSQGSDDDDDDDDEFLHDDDMSSLSSGSDSDSDTESDDDDDDNDVSERRGDSESQAVNRSVILIDSSVDEESEIERGGARARRRGIEQTVDEAEEAGAAVAAAPATGPTLAKRRRTSSLT